MTDEELARLAEANGVAVEYHDWRGRRTPVPRDTILAVLEALGALSESDHPRPPSMPEPTRGVRAADPPRTWGFMVQLYSARSTGSWGHGDLRDLADLAAWSGSALGAGFVLINPLHAGEPATPIRPSPYLPSSRRFVSPLYLRVEDVPGYDVLPPEDRERIAELAAPLRAANHTLAPLDRDAVWAAKSTALELIHRRAPLDRSAAKAYASYRGAGGAALTGFATWCALAESYGADWRDWPAGLRDPRSQAVVAERVRRADRVEFHAWLQWLVQEQVATAQRTARAAGMPLGVIHDLAVGVHPGGADAWLYQDVLASGVTVGAPPDEFNQRGQDWGQPPWHPRRLAARAYEPYRELISASLRASGGLRVDHVLGLFRQWWVPIGASPAEGTYVRCDHEAMTGLLAAAAERADALVIGEDLGVVQPWVREYLPSRGLFGTSMLWFERDGQGEPLRPERWRSRCLATVATHDMPPIAGYLAGDHIRLRAELGLLTRPAAEEWADHRRQLARWSALLGELGLLTGPEDLAANPDAATAALHGFLARTPARLVGISLADAVGERRTQNQPGTIDEYPNWRVPLADAEGRAVLLDDLPDDPRVRAAVAPVRSLGAR
ncbi:MAG TPA: 4-alpha-glucanotransferase [Streptosporangiaceae bacterium]